MAMRHLMHFALLVTTIGMKEVLDSNSFLQLVTESGAALDASGLEEVAPVEEIAKAEIELQKKREEQREQETEVLKKIVEMMENEVHEGGRESSVTGHAAGEDGAGSGSAIEMEGREIGEKEENEARGVAERSTRAVQHVAHGRVLGDINRSEPRAASQCSDNLIAVGGYKTWCQRSHEAWAYDAGSGSWSPIDNFPGNGVDSFGAAYYDGGVYVFGGKDCGWWYADVHRYAPAQGAWELLGGMPQKDDTTGRRRRTAPGTILNVPHVTGDDMRDGTEIAYHKAAVLDGYIYLVGGRLSAKCDRFDPVALTWEVMSNMQYKRQIPCVTAFEGKIWACCGLEQPKVCEAFDPPSNTWEAKISPDAASSLQRDIRGGALGAVGDRMYLVSGYSTMYYESSTGAWTAMSQVISTPRNRGAMAISANYIYMVDGIALPTPNVEPPMDRFDLQTQEWGQVAGRPDFRVEGALVALSSPTCLAPPPTQTTTPTSTATSSTATSVTVTATSVTTTTHDDQSSVVGDPHVVNVAHARFEIRAEGMHKLVQIPQFTQASKPDLRVDAKVEHLVSNDCSKSFMTSLSIFGRWTEDAFGLMRISQGSDMPNTTLLINAESPEEFSAQFPSPDVKPGHASIAFKLKDVSFHVGKHYEGRYGEQKAYLNVRIGGLKKYHDLGGLLGYDDHADAEKLAANCTAAEPPAAYQSSFTGSGRSAPTITDGGSRIEAE